MRSILLGMTYEQRIRQEVERVCGTRELVQLHCSPEEPESFEVGRVVRVSRTAATVEMFGASGRPDGMRSVEIEIIVGITIGGAYLEMVRAMIEAGPERLASVAVMPSEDGHVGMLRAAMDAQVPVTLRFEEESVAGFVREVGEDWASIAQTDEDTGADAGTRIVPLDGLDRIFVGGHEEMRLAFVARERMLRDQLG